MRLALRKSIPVKIVAIGFIISIIFGNIWIVDMILGTEAPGWVRNGFFTGFLLAAGGGIGMIGWTLLFWGRKDQYDDEDEDAPGDNE